MIDRRLRAEKVLEIYAQNKYLIMTESDGYEVGINARIIRTKRMKTIVTRSRLKWRTRFVSWRAVGLMEYISKKAPYQTA